MNAWSALLALTFIFVAGCDSPEPRILETAKGEQVAVPTFSISISLDAAAMKKLADAGESIKGHLVFDGDGTPLPGVKTAPHRDVFLGVYEFELEKPGTIQISNATISAEAFARLSDKNYHFYINVVSGRRSFKNNVLNDGYAQGRFEDLRAGHDIKVACKLL